jgi:hypothetical protein
MGFVVSQHSPQRKEIPVSRKSNKSTKKPPASGKPKKPTETRSQPATASAVSRDEIAPVLTDDQRLEAVGNLGQRAKSDGLPLDDLDKLIVGVSWKLVMANRNRGTRGLGACCYTTLDGKKHCCLLTADECSLISGAKFHAGKTCEEVGLPEG